MNKPLKKSEKSELQQLLTDSYITAIKTGTGGGYDINDSSFHSEGRLDTFYGSEHQLLAFLRERNKDYWDRRRHAAWQWKRTNEYFRVRYGTIAGQSIY